MALNLRLTATNPDLAAKISEASPSMQREIALRVVELLFAEADERAGTAETMAALRAGHFGDSPLRTWLLEYGSAADKLARQAWKANDKAKTDQEQAKASAFKAAHYALSEDSEQAALEVVYVGRFSNVPGEVARLARSVLENS